MQKKSNTKPRFKKRSSSPKFSKSDREEEAVGKSKINDPDWYVKEPQLVKDVASFSFNNALGAEYTLVEDSPGTSFGFTSKRISSFLPGVMSIMTGPAVNPSGGAYSALNLATKDLFKRVRKMNAGSTNYDSPDLMLYILAMDSIYAGIFFLQRIYGCATVYSQVNRYVGDAFIEAQGVDPASVRSDLARYRARLNMLITKVSAFATPRDINLFKRHAWMYSGIYMDEPVKKAQVFMYIPAYIYKYVETSGGPGYLKPQYICGVFANPTADLSLRILTRTRTNTLASARLMTVDQLFAYIEECVQAVVESQDMNIMSGDILKAYGDENVWKMTLVDENYSTIPVYSEEVLDQIHNTHFTGILPTKTLDLTQPITYSDERLRITQVVSESGNYLVYQPQFASCMQNSITHILDMCDDNPTPERVIVATRNMLGGNTANVTGSGGGNITNITTCGSDICINATVYALDNGAMSPITEVGSFADQVTDVYRYGKFHKAPILYQFNNGALRNVTGEIGNFTIVNHNDVQKLHETAMLSLLGVSV